MEDLLTSLAYEIRFKKVSLEIQISFLKNGAKMFLATSELKKDKLINEILKLNEIKESRNLNILVKT